jgi:hypothetical protein
MISFLIILSSVNAHANPLGRNTSKDTHPKIKFVTKATKLAAKSYAIKRYGRNINILSNRLIKKSIVKKKYGLKNSSCRRVVLKTKNGDRKTLNICDKIIKNKTS